MSISGPGFRILLVVSLAACAPGASVASGAPRHEAISSRPEKIIVSWGCRAKVRDHLLAAFSLIEHKQRTSISALLELF